MNRKLYRTERDKIIAGVCGGVAEYFNADPTLIRVLWALATFVGGVGVWVYIIFAIVVPPKSRVIYQDNYYGNTNENSNVNMNNAGYQSNTNGPINYSNNDNEMDRSDSKRTLGIVLIVIGLVFISKEISYWLFHIDFFSFRYIFPVALIGAGAYFIYTAVGGNKDEK